MTKTFDSKVAPKAIGPYSHGVIFNEVLYLSGQLGVNPETNGLVEGGVEAQTRQIMQNIQSMLEEAGTSLDKVIRCRIYMTDINDFDLVNAVYGEFLGHVKPARSAVQVAALPLGAKIEIECTAKMTTYIN